MNRVSLLITISLCLTLSGYTQGWIKQESNTNAFLTSACFVNPDIGFVVGYNGTILKTFNGGNDWQIKPSGTTNHLISVHFVDSLNGFAISGQELIRTTNGGESWYVQDTVKNGYFHDMQFISRDTGFVAGNTMLKTVDAGASWVKQKSLGGSFFSFWATDSNTMFIGADYFWIFRSIDGGVNWAVSHDQGFPVNMLDIWFTSRNNGYAIGGGFAQGTSRTVLVRTNDGGETWSLLLNMESLTFNSIFFANDSVGFIAGSHGTLLKTTDAGNQWNPLNSNTTENLNTIFFIDSLTGYAVGANGTILKTTDGGISSANQSEDEKDITLFPNPVTDHLQIETKQNDFQGVLSIYTILGTLIHEQSISGPVTRLDISGLSPGIYLAKVADQVHAKTFRLVKQ